MPRVSLPGHRDKPAPGFKRKPMRKPAPLLRYLRDNPGLHAACRFYPTHCTEKPPKIWSWTTCVTPNCVSLRRLCTRNGLSPKRPWWLPDGLRGYPIKVVVAPCDKTIRPTSMRTVDWHCAIAITASSVWDLAGPEEGFLPSRHTSAFKKRSLRSRRLPFWPQKYGDGVITPGRQRRVRPSPGPRHSIDLYHASQWWVGPASLGNSGTKLYSKYVLVQCSNWRGVLDGNTPPEGLGLFRFSHHAEHGQPLDGRRQHWRKAVADDQLAPGSRDHLLQDQSLGEPSQMVTDLHQRQSTGNEVLQWC